MKKALFIIPLLCSGCVTSDFIHIAASGAMFTVATHVEEWHLKHEAKMDSLRPIRQARRDSIRAPKIARRDSIKQIKIEKRESRKTKTTD